MKQERIWPGLISAGSRVSILFVAMITFTSPLESNPSSWFNSSNIVRWISLSPPEFESYLWKREREGMKTQLICSRRRIRKNTSISTRVTPSTILAKKSVYPPHGQDTHHIIFFITVWINDRISGMKSPYLVSGPTWLSSVRGDPYPPDVSPESRWYLAHSESSRLKKFTASG